MQCIICKYNSTEFTKRDDVQYYQCEYCKTVWCNPVSNENMVGGEYEVERNTSHNEQRIKRLLELYGGDKEKLKVLDFGCGHGLFLKELDKAGIWAEGYDLYNPSYSRMPTKKYNAVVMVEVVEHMSYPFSDLDLVNSLLEKNGFVYIETSFVEVAKEEKIPLKDFFYIAPNSGHCTIFSHYALDLLMKQKGFLPMNHINRHVRIFKKI